MGAYRAFRKIRAYKPKSTSYASAGRKAAKKYGGMFGSWAWYGKRGRKKTRIGRYVHKKTYIRRNSRRRWAT